MVDSLNIFNFPPYIDPAAFASAVMDESQTGAVELTLLEAALEAEGLNDLAEVVGIVGINRASSLLGEAKLREIIERISRGRSAQVKEVVRKLHQHSAVARQLGDLERAKAHLLAEIRAASWRENGGGEEMPLLVGARDIALAPAITPPPQPASGAERNRLSSMRELTRDETLGGGHWRKMVLPLVLARGVKGERPLLGAIWILTGSRVSVSLKIIALRVLEDHRAGFDEDLNTYVRILQILAEILESETSNPKLKGMAFHLLDKICRRWYRGNLLHGGPLGYAYDFARGARKMVLYQITSTDSEIPLTADRIGKQLYASLDRLLSARRSEFDPYPLWPTLLPEALGINMVEEAPFEKLVKIFSNPQEPFYRRALAIVLYELSGLQKKPQSQAQATEFLLPLRTTLDGLESDKGGEETSLLIEMVHHVRERYSSLFLRH